MATSEIEKPDPFDEFELKIKDWREEYNEKIQGFSDDFVLALRKEKEIYEAKKLALYNRYQESITPHRKVFTQKISPFLEDLKHALSSSIYVPGDGERIWTIENTQKIAVGGLKLPEEED